MDGKLLLAGIDRPSLAPDRWLNVVYALMVEDIAGNPSPYLARKAIDEVLAPAKPKFDPDTWGDSPEALAEQEAVMKALSQ